MKKIDFFIINQFERRHIATKNEDHTVTWDHDIDPNRLKDDERVYIDMNGKYTQTIRTVLDLKAFESLSK
jgi:hypothetical protein